MRRDDLVRLNMARRKRVGAIAMTEMASGRSRLVVETEDYAGDPLGEALARRFQTGASGLDTERGVFFTVHLPPPRLVAIGAVHVSQALTPMARLAGFDVTILDPRTAFATPERFPDVDLIAEWPVDALPRVGLDAFTALAALTHDPKIDDGALVAALAAGCFYVGALGSRKTHAKRLDRLRAAGVGEAQLGLIHAPIGLAIGAQSPAEIAVSILAEIVAALRSRGRIAAEAPA